jgi:hypothetical protein
MRHVVALVGCLAFGLAREAHADSVVWMPGNSREIQRTVSASRDAPVSGLTFTPRVEAKGAADFAFVKIDFGDAVLRPGAFAFFELEHADPGLQGPLPLPGEGKGPMLWRGMFGASLALSAERLAHAWLGPRGAVEITVTAGHESDHVTGASFNDAPQRGDIIAGGGGNFILYDVAIRRSFGSHLDGWARIEDRAYWLGPVLHAPGAEMGVRWHMLPHFEPLLAVFGEALLVNHNLNGANDGGFGSLLGGIGLPGALGELLPYTALDVGNGKGLLINRRELTLSIGVRYAPF